MCRQPQLISFSAVEAEMFPCVTASGIDFSATSTLQKAEIDLITSAEPPEQPGMYANVTDRIRHVFRM